MIKKTFNIYQISSVFVFICSLLMYFIFSISRSNGEFCNIQLISIIGLLFYFFIVFSWKKNYNRILSPSFIFITTLYLCLCGQSIMWSFGLNAGYRDLQTWSKLLSSHDICKGLLFSYCCLLFLHCVVMLNVKDKKMTKSKECQSTNIVLYNNEKAIYKTMLLFGLIICIIFIAPYLMSVSSTYSIITKYGYAAQYDQSVYGTGSIIIKLGEFFPIGVLTLFYAFGRKTEYNKNNYWLKALFVYSLVLLYLISEIMIEQRTGVILFSVAFIFIVFKDKKISKKQIFFGVLLMFLLMSSMRMMDLIRSNKYYDLSSFFNLFIDYENNPVVDFLGDIGWNLFTLVEYQKMIPAIRNFGYGITYIVTLTSIIPNINFWAIHPATQYGEISGWLRIYLGYKFGLGCTPIAEAYYNFGSFGFLIFYFWGKLLIFFNKKYEDSSILSNYMVVLFIGILLKSCVRSSFVAVFRPMLLYVFLPILFVKILYKKFKK